MSPGARSKNGDGDEPNPGGDERVSIPVATLSQHLDGHTPAPNLQKVLFPKLQPPLAEETPRSPNGNNADTTDKLAVKKILGECEADSDCEDNLINIQYQLLSGNKSQYHYCDNIVEEFSTAHLCMSIPFHLLLMR